MISDITLGQFSPQKSPLHSADPRMKICLVIFAIVLLFVAQNFISLALVVVYICLGMALSRIPVKLYLKSLKPILFLVAFTGILNIFYGTGDPLWQWGIFENHCKRHHQLYFCFRADYRPDSGQFRADLYHISHPVDRRH